MNKLLISLIFVLFFGAIGSQSQPMIQSYNLGFELGPNGNEPIGWEILERSKQKGFTFFQTDEDKASGKMSLEISSPRSPEDGEFGSIFQSIYAKPFINKKVVFRVVSKVLPNDSTCKLLIWATVRDAKNQIVQNFNNEQNPITEVNWQPNELVIEIDNRAAFINYGFMLLGSGKCFVDDVAFFVQASDDKFNSPPKEVSKKSLDYLSAFSQIYGLLKFYYPSEKNEQLDWQKLALAGVGIAETSKNDEDFASRIITLVKPYSPLLSIKNNDKFEPITNPANDSKTAMSFLHKGIASDFPTLITGTKFVNVFESQRDGAGLAIQATNTSVGEHLGKKFILSIAANAETENFWSFANILIRFENLAKQTVASFSLKEPYIVDKNFREYTIEDTIPLDAKYFRIGLNLYGEGKVLMDDIKLKVVNPDGSSTELPINNSDFESARSSFIAGWTIPDYSLAAGYDISIVKNVGISSSSLDNHVLLIKSNSSNKTTFPSPNVYYTEKLSGTSLYIALPTVLYADSNGTIPVSDIITDFSVSGKPDDFVLNDKDRESRIAIVLDAWNYLRHFNTFEAKDSLLLSNLRRCIAKAATDKDETDFLRTLNLILATSNDNQARAWKTSHQSTYSLPILWKWIDKKLLITAIKDNNFLKVGDEIIQINGTDTEKFLNQYEEAVAGNNPLWKRQRALAELRSGSFGSSIKLRIKRLTEKPFDLELKRNIFSDELTEQRPIRISVADEDVIYCDMTRATDNELKELIRDIERAKAIIFDCRGIASMSEHTLGLFATKQLNSNKALINHYTMPLNKMISVKDYSSVIKSINKLQTLRPVFLCDERTIGLSEQIISIAKSNRLGTVIGRPSAGNAGEIAAVRLFADYNFSSTILKVFSSNGEMIFGKGIEPDIFVPASIDENFSETDKVIERAKKYLKENK